MMSDIVAGLWRCPPPLRKPLADKLFARGVRVSAAATVKVVLEGLENLGNWRPAHVEDLPATATPSHSEKLPQVRALAAALSADIPRKELCPAIANDLYQIGCRVHSELAEVPAPEHVPSRYEPFEIVRQFAPELAAQMQAAETEEDREAIREQIRHRHGSRIADIAEGIDNL